MRSFLKQFGNMMRLDSAHDRKRDMQTVAGFADDFQTERMNRRIFGLCRVNRSQIDVCRTFRLRFQSLFARMGGTPDQQFRSKLHRRSQRQVLLPQMYTVRSAHQRDVEMVVHNHKNAVTVADSAEGFGSPVKSFPGKTFLPQLNDPDSGVRRFLQHTQRTASGSEFIRNDCIQIRFPQFLQPLFFPFAHDMFLF